MRSFGAPSPPCSVPGRTPEPSRIDGCITSQTTGDKELYGEFLVNAHGEDVVAGLRTPHALTEAPRKAMSSSRPSLEGLMPDVFAELKSACAKLEAHFRDIQDI